jgi:hypothetical protein
VMGVVVSAAAVASPEGWQVSVAGCFGGRPNVGAVGVVGGARELAEGLACGVVVLPDRGGSGWGC